MQKKSRLETRIFPFSDKNLLYHPVTLILQSLWESKLSRSDPLSHKTNLHIPNIKNNEFKIKNDRFFQTRFYFPFTFLDNTLYKFWDQSSFTRDQCFLQVSETISWHQLCCYYSSNMLPDWVVGTWFISEKSKILEIPEVFPGINLVSIIHERYCHKMLGS